ncbi:MAG: hypothetical protein EOS06_10400 [Mesorhizobium sp.]|nr:MAG: hypothetical protein EOS06_10400 [Mesorhizobium sp.]
MAETYSTSSSQGLRRVASLLASPWDDEGVVAHGLSQTLVIGSWGQAAANDRPSSLSGSV